MRSVHKKLFHERQHARKLSVRTTQLPDFEINILCMRYIYCVSRTCTFVIPVDISVLLLECQFYKNHVEL